ncbi:hypothetical protein DN479_31250, partial [Burkholderia multivorans]
MTGGRNHDGPELTPAPRPRNRYTRPRRASPRVCVRARLGGCARHARGSAHRASGPRHGPRA